MILPDFTKAKVLIVGDLMLDLYWSGGAGRISPEAPVPVVNVSGSEDRAGGAANVAVNAATLGANVTLLGMCGDDENAKILKERLQTLVNENQEAAKKIKDNEVVALKLQGAIEALEYYNENPPTEVPSPDEEVVDNLETA